MHSYNVSTLVGTRLRLSKDESADEAGGQTGYISHMHIIARLSLTHDWPLQLLCG